MGAAIQLVVDWAGDPGRVIDYVVRFSRPVPVPATGQVFLEVSGQVSQVDGSSAKIGLTVSLDGVKVLGRAQATVRL
jgi:acyl dehydratase